MTKYLRILIFGLALNCNALPASANWLYTPGGGPSAFVSFNSGTTPPGTSLCAAANTDCLANIPINLAGNPLFVTGNAGLVTGTGGTFPATQSGTWTVQPGNTPNTTAWLVTGTGGTFPVTGTFFQATQPVSAVSLPLPTGAATQTTLASVLTALGTPFQAGGSIGNTAFIANAGTNLNTSALATQTTLASVLTALGTPFQAGGSIGNTAFIANAGTNLNTSALSTSANQTNASQKTQIVDGAGAVIASTSNNLNVQCANCSGSGASAVDGASFTVGTSVFAPIGGQYTSGGATACVTTKQCLAGMTSAREVMVSDAALLAAAATPLPSMPVNKTPTACGGTISTGGTAQNAFTAQTTLQGFVLMNLSIDPMWMSFTGTAAIGGANDSFLLPAGSSTISGGSFAAPGGFGTNHALSVIAATTSDAYSCVWW